jgi:hypothetical protein
LATKFTELNTSLIKPVFYWKAHYIDTKKNM